MPFADSTVEQAAIEWFEDLGYSSSYGPTIAPGEPTAERFAGGSPLSSLLEALPCTR